jgi:hypothetical protein
MELGVTLLRSDPSLRRLEDCRRMGPMGQFHLEVGTQREVDLAPGERIERLLMSLEEGIPRNLVLEVRCPLDRAAWTCRGSVQ